MNYVTVLVKIPKEKFDVLTSDEFYTFPTECKEWGSRAIRNGIPIGNYTSSSTETIEKTLKKEEGHWIGHKHDGIEHIECSKCRCWFLRKDLIRNSYCPNCGSYNGGKND